MPKLEIVWDADKAERNVKRHGVTFEEAASCFDDELARQIAALSIPTNFIPMTKHATS